MATIFILGMIIACWFKGWSDTDWKLVKCLALSLFGMVVVLWPID